MKKEPRLACVGDNCMDVYDTLGEAHPGGNPVNVAVYTVRLGGCASYLGAVGTDENGKLMRRALADKGVDIIGVQVLNGKTAVTHVALKDGERILGDYEPGVMDSFTLKDVDIEYIASHDLMVSGLWGMIEHDLIKIKANGIPIAFDFADKPDHEIAKIAMPNVDYAFFSMDGEEGEIVERLRCITSAGPRLAVATRGELGSLAYDGNRLFRYGIVPCTVVDTMGAGDSYIAGFLFGLMRGWPVEKCMAHGAMNSSVTLAYKGAW